MNEQWDAGELGCSQLIFELKVRMRNLRPGSRLEVTARDPGAPIDIPAWCQMTGNPLISDAPPVYVIERRRD